MASREAAAMSLFAPKRWCRMDMHLIAPRRAFSGGKPGFTFPENALIREPAAMSGSLLRGHADCRFATATALSQDFQPTDYSDRPLGLS
jgi:hypothetical protein